MKHAAGINGCDYALCGVSMDGDPEVLDLDGQMPRLAGQLQFIECDQCLAIIGYCHRAFQKHRGCYRPFDRS